LHNQILRPVQWDRMLYLSILDHGRPLGALNFGRPENAPDFSQREIRLLEAVMPFVAHALTDRVRDGPCVETDEAAIIIANSRGKVVHLSHHARSLLLKAQYSLVSPQVAHRMRSDVLPGAVVRLCGMLSSEDEDTLLPAPPVWRCRNSWGEFVFRAYALEPTMTTETSRLIGINLELRKPLMLSLHQRVDRLALSKREAQLCLALTGPETRSQIAARFGVSEHTVVAHARSLYGKLDVHSRVELTDRVRAA